MRPARCPLIFATQKIHGEAGRQRVRLEAQREAIYRHIGSYPFIEEYREIESGKRNDRPQLKAALAQCKKAKATLSIAKLDRLVRNLQFISGLMESGVDFVAADNPHATRLFVHMMAAFAEHKRDMISKRTKDALAAKKARGAVFGNPRWHESIGKATAKATPPPVRLAASR